MTVFVDAGSPADDIENHERSFADMVERLFAQFEDRLPLPMITATVRSARRDLQGSPIGALPELTERLAFERLRAFDQPS